MRELRLALGALTATLLTPGMAVAGETASVQDQLRVAQQQIALLQAQLNQLQTQIQAQGDAQARTAADVQAIAGKTDQALAQATAASAQAAKPAPVPDALKWASETKLSGRMYFNASSVSHEVNGSKTGNTDNGGGYAIKRFYLGVDHQFDKTFSANLTTDVSAISGVGQTLYIKKAYLQAKVAPALTVRLGAADMPWIPYAESIYGYRHIDQTVSDRTKFGTSADWGVHVLGDLAGGLVSYQVSAVDGGGYRDPKFSRTIDLEGRVSAKYKGFNVAVGGYTGKLGRNTQGSAAARTYSRFNALAAYTGKIGEVPVTLGAEYFHAKNKAFNSTAPILASAVSDSADGYSLFASAAPLDKWSVFGRYDWVNPTNRVNSAFRENFYNVGVQYTPSKIVNLALVYKRERAENGAFSTGSLQSGVIGCSTSATAICTGSGTYSEIGVYGQFRF